MATKKATAAHVITPPVDRALARLALVHEWLSKAKDANPENYFPIGAADAEALFGLVWAAEEDLHQLRDEARKGAS